MANNLLGILGALLLAISVPSWGYSYGESPYEVTPMCQKMQQICGVNRPYSCCPGLQCMVSPFAVGGGLCIPELPAPLDQVVGAVDRKPSYDRQGFGDLCVQSGPYSCGNGLQCMVSPQLPPGVGLCAPRTFPTSQLKKLLYALFGRPPKCQEKLQLCANYGPQKCCKRRGLYCRITNKVAGVGVCTPFGQ